MANFSNIDFKQHSKGLIALVISALGIVTLYLWQPISDFFITGAYDEILTLKTEFETVDQQGNEPLLVIQAKVTNRGNVPVKIDPSKTDQTIEIYELGEIKKFEWLSDSKGKLVAKKTFFEGESAEIQVAPSSHIERLSAIRLPHGIYVIKTKLKIKTGVELNETEIYENNKLTNTKTSERLK
jgi:hypothetical protein